MNTSTNCEQRPESGTGGAHDPSGLGVVLEAGEKVLWTGRPIPFRIVRSKAAPALFGSVLLIMLTMTPLQGLLFSRELSFNAGGLSPRGLVSGFVLLLASCSLLVPVIAFRRATSTWYAVTDRRILRFWRGRLNGGAALDEVDATSIRTSDDGTGDIHLWRGLAFGDNTTTGFLGGISGIADAERVHQMINEAREERRRSRERPVDDYLEFLLKGKRQDDLPRK